MGECSSRLCQDGPTCSARASVQDAGGGGGGGRKLGRARSSLYTTPYQASSDVVKNLYLQPQAPGPIGNKAFHCDCEKCSFV